MAIAHAVATVLNYTLKFYLPGERNHSEVLFVKRLDMTDLEKKIDLFFTDPSEMKGLEPYSYGILHLLRRDISMCFGFDPSWKKDIPYRAFWPGVMAIMAGVDLLGKFYRGNDEVGDAKRGFIKFYEEYFDSENAEIIYQLRNALLHSFALYSEDRKGVIYRFILDRCRTGTVVEKASGEHYRIYIDLLWMMFEKAIELYHKDLMQNDLLKENFEMMFQKFGSTKIGF